MLLNRILTNKDRKELSYRVDEMFKHCPDMMSRKISEANVQQAFVLDTVIKNTSKDDKILCVGSFEDSAMATLESMGYSDVFGIDPDINFSLNEYCDQVADEDVFYDIVFATSVLEHVQDDELFVGQMCELLTVDGWGIITCDFNNEYVPGNSVPATVVRQYTRADLEDRLQKVLHYYGCKIVGEYDWTAEPDFIYQGHLYSFATFVFERHV